MRIVRVSGENFGRYRKFSFEVGSRGFVGVLGINQDGDFVGAWGIDIDGDVTSTSNGSGKSTLMEAPGWGLYGYTHRHGYVTEGVVAPWSDWCEVRVELQGVWKDAIVTVIRRVDKGAHTLVIKSGGNETEGQDLRDTQARIDAMMGQTWNVFSSASSFGQRKLHQWPLLEPAKVRGIFNEALNLGLYDIHYKTAKDKHKEAIQELNADEIRVEEARKTIDAIKEDIREKTTSLDKWKKLNKKKIPSKKKHNAKLAVLDKKIQKAKDIYEETRELARVLQEKISGVDRELTGINTEIRLTREAISINEDLLKSSKQKKTCPTCGQALGKVETKKVISGYVREIMRNRKSLDESIKDRESVTSKLNELKEEIGEGGPDPLAPYREELEDLKQKKAELISTRKDQESLQTMGKDLEESIAKAEKRLDRKRRELAGLAQSRDRWEYRVSGLKYLMDYYGPSGARLIKLNRYTPVLNHYAAKYATHFLGGGAKIEFSTVKKLKSGEFREKFSVTVEMDGAADNYLSMSGGERQRADLACNLAFRAMMMDLANKKSNLLICDEVFDGLDAAGRGALTEFLNDEIGDDGTCFVISHEADLVRHYPETIKVRKKGGVCQVLK